MRYLPFLDFYYKKTHFYKNLFENNGCGTTVVILQFFYVIYHKKFTRTFEK